MVVATRASRRARVAATNHDESGGCETDGLHVAVGPRASLLQFSRVFTRATSVRSAIRPEWRQHLSRPASLYGASSWMYAAVGFEALVQTARCPASMPGMHASWLWSPRIAMAEAALLMGQGAWSFASDVVFVGTPSRFHCVDRISAISLVCVQLVKFGVLFPHALAATELAVVWSSLALGGLCKVMSSRAIVADSPEDFCRWHTRWHVWMPLAMAMVHANRWRACAACAEDVCDADALKPVPQVDRRYENLFS